MHRIRVLITAAKNLLAKGHIRTVKAKKNILLAAIYRMIGLVIGFLYFPISLSYLDPIKFGIFLTMSSMIDWFVELDVGIGNGLRNRLGEAIADGNDEKARGYVSTAYFVVGGIYSFAAIVFVVVSFFAPWSDWLKADPLLNQEIAILAMLMFGAMAIRFVSSLVYEVFYALQRTAMVYLFNTIGKVVFLLIIISLFYFTDESLLLFGVARTFTFALIPLAVGIYFFRRELQRFRPSYKLVKKEYFKDLFSLGFQFFIIQLATIVIYQSNNFLIARYASLEAVPQYQAANKYLSIFLILFTIITNQIWSANIEAYRMKELDWMKKVLRGVFRVWVGSVLLMVVMIFIAPFFYEFWLQGKIEISVSLTVIVGLSIATTIWINMFNLVINGTGKIRVQMVGWIIASILNIPLSILFAKVMDFGVIGVVYGTIVSLIPLAILSPIQVKMVLSGKERGIWAK